MTLSVAAPRRALAGLFPTLGVSVFVLVAAAWTPLGAGSPTTPAGSSVRGLDAAALFPDTTLFLLNVDGRPCAKHAKELGLARIFNAPETQEFLAPVLAQAGGLWQAGLANAEAPFDLEEALGLLGTGRTLLGVTRFETETVDKGDFKTEALHVDLMFALNFAQGRQAAVKAVLDSVEKAIKEESTGPAPKDVKIGGIDAKTIVLQQGEEFRPFSSLTYVVVDDWLLVATNDAQLEGAVQRAKSGEIKGSLLADASYAQCAKATMREKTVFSMFLHTKELLARVAKTEAGPEILKAVKGSGVDQMGALCASSELDGMAVRDRFYVQGYNPTGVVDAPDMNRLLALIPKSSSMVSAAAADLPKTFDFIAGLFASQGVNDFAKGIARFEKKHQLSVRDDLLAPFGPEWGYYAALPKHGLIPDVGFVFRARDEAKAEAALKKALGIAGVNSVDVVKHRGADIKVAALDHLGLELDGLPMAPRPSYCFVDGFLLVTAWPQAAKNFLDAAAKKDGGFALRDDAAAAFARIKADVPGAGAAGVGYVDMAGMAGFVIDTLAPLVQMVDASRIGLDMAKFPPTEVFTANLPPMLATTQYDKDGMLVVMSSPTGMGTLYMFGVGAMAGVMAAQGEMFTTGETRVIEVTPSEPVKDGGDDDKDK